MLVLLVRGPRWSVRRPSRLGAKRIHATRCRVSLGYIGSEPARLPRNGHARTPDCPLDLVQRSRDHSRSVPAALCDWLLWQLYHALDDGDGAEHDVAAQRVVLFFHLFVYNAGRRVRLLLPGLRYRALSSSSA